MLIILLLGTLPGPSFRNESESPKKNEKCSKSIIVNLRIVLVFATAQTNVFILQEVKIQDNK